VDEEPTPVLAELVEIVHQLEQAFTIPLRLAQLEASQATDAVQIVADERDRLRNENIDLMQMWNKSRHRNALSDYRRRTCEAVDAAEALRVKFNGLKVALEELHKMKQGPSRRYCAHCNVIWPCETKLQLLMHLGPNPSLDELDVIDD
jgi:hypothetical protein